MVHGRRANLDHYVLAGHVRIGGYRLQLDGVRILPSPGQCFEGMAMVHPCRRYHLLCGFQ